MSHHRINIYDEEFNKILHTSKVFESSREGRHYKDIMCLKEIKRSKKHVRIDNSFEKFKNHIVNSKQEILDQQKNFLCVRPIGHEGRCAKNPLKKMFKKSVDKEFVKTLTNKIENSIYMSPGENKKDSIICNRTDRLYPLVISVKAEKLLKDRVKDEVKEQSPCMIRLKDFSTPFCLATAYLDFMIYYLSVRGITTDYIDNDSNAIKEYSNSIDRHRQFLINYFRKHRRRAFSDRLSTLCCVLQKEISVKNMIDPERDTRSDPDGDDVQMGHLISRNKEGLTVRGMNLSIMTREGNRIIGEHGLFENHWIKQLMKIVSSFNMKQKIE